MRTGLAIAAMMASVVLVGLSIAGRSRLAGPVLLKVTSTHGIHAGDAVSLLVGIVSVAAIGLLWHDHGSGG